MNVNLTSTENDLLTVLTAYQGNNTANALSLLPEGGHHSGAKPDASDQAQLSGTGQLFTGLAALSSTNPKEFKKLTAQIAQELRNTAQANGTAAQPSLLTQLAASFGAASNSGNFSDLFAQGQLSLAAATNDGYSSVVTQNANVAEQVTAIFSQALSLLGNDAKMAPA